MIVSIESSIPTFKTLRFRAGLNVLLADTTPGASGKQTRNSAGKTSFVEILHFLLGANCDKQSLFRTQALIAESFSGTFIIGGEQLSVSRSGTEPSRVYFIQGPAEKLGIPLKTERESGKLYVSNAHWRDFLGHQMFGLPNISRGTVFDEPDAPSFRSLVSYFARRRNSGGLSKPEQIADQQQRSDWQVNLSYLLGLDWEIPLAFQRIRERERMLEELKKAAKGGALGDVVGTVADLRPQITIAEAKATKMREQLSRFEVLDSYRDLSQRAARTRNDMRELTRDIIQLRETLDYLERALKDEHPLSRDDLSKMYEAAGLQLPGVALRRFDEVSKFHESVVRNRRAHLEAEINETKNQIAQAERNLGSLDLERRNILATLEGRGALEDFISLQRQLAELDATASNLKERYKAAELLEGSTTQLDLDRTNLKQRLQEDHRQREGILDKAILLISESISALYEDRAGRFVVEATSNGPEFRISIEGDRGGGIASMEIFCLDLALFEITHERFNGTGFLVHDSHLFDGVDERQVAIALGLGSQKAGETRQYIVTMNSDVFDRLPFGDDIDPDTFVCPTRLSDVLDTGGLFGFRFD